MRRKDADIKLILIDIILVVSILLTLGALNTLISKGVSANALLWGGIGIGVCALSIIMKRVYSRFKARSREAEDNKPDGGNNG